MKRSQPRRDWSQAERKRTICRNCGAEENLTLAHIAGRAFDQPKTWNGQPSKTLFVHPDSVVCLCGPVGDTRSCHSRFDRHELDLLGKLTPEEEARAVLDLQGLENARVRLCPSEYRKAAA